MKFFILEALIAVAAADSYRSAEYEPTYVAPVAPRYEAPQYQAASYGAVNYDTAEPYEFGYSVKDAETYADFDHSEKSDGKVTTGSYRVQLPDGRTQIVTYKADSYGYTADVKYEGETKYPEYVQSKYNSYSAPAYSAPAYKAAPAFSAPAYRAPEYSAPAYNAPAYDAPAY
ncbi:hypothetical protein GHT06_013835 [Daphnia sinensis]|uniref:Cuticle protein n=1 Tax=Daphnia sinensis TaxID=1820382 RepID=A0AAD5PVN7_9CRUS|nr:hypothetical protein GHT06_013835 [Daphnia sinensis]